MSAPDLRVGAAWLAGGFAIRSAAYLGTALVLARLLGPADYGQLSLFIALSAGVAYLAGSWPVLAVPVLVAEKQSLAAALRGAMAVSGAAATFLFVLALPFALSLESPATAVAALAIYAVALLVLQAVYGLWQTQERMPPIAAAQGAERVIALAAVGALAAGGAATLVGARFAVTAGAVAVAVVALAGPLRRSGALRAHTGRSAQAVLRAVGALAIVAACSYGVAYVDVLVLGALRGDRDVGVYAVAYQVFTFVLQLGSLWTIVALPRQAREVVVGNAVEAMLPRKRLLPAVRLWAGGVLIVACAAAVGLEPLFGSPYSEAVGPLMLLLSSAGVLAVYFACVPVLIAQRRTRWLAQLSIAGIVVNIVGDLVLIPWIGIWGPAVATGLQNLGVTTALAVSTLGPGGARSALLGSMLPVTTMALLAGSQSGPVVAAAAMVGFVVMAAGLRGTVGR